MKISIIGGGSWGISLAKVLADNKHEVLVYDNSQEVIDGINNKHISVRLEDAPIPKSIKATNNIKDLVTFSDHVLVSIPTKVIRVVLGQFATLLDKPKHFINVSKGIEPNTDMRMSQVYEDVLKDKMLTYTVLTGPSHAEEVIKEMLTIVTVSSTDKKQQELIQTTFTNKKYFRVYMNDDLIGCELGGALKNVIAIAGGYIYGIGLGDNARAALLTRAIREMERIFEVYSGRTSTLYGIAGLGDLIVTATSLHSRNFKAGMSLAKGLDVKLLTSTVEGVRTCKAVHEVIEKNKIHAPIFKALYETLFGNLSAEDAIPLLLSSTNKIE